MSERTLRTVLTKVALAVLALGSVALVGCTETDLIRSETTGTALEVEPSSASGSVFESGTAGISQVFIRPIDPDVAAVVGGTGEFGLIPSQGGFSFDLYSGIIEVEGNSLHPGVYEVTSMVLRRLVLVNDDPAAPGEPVDCIEMIAELPGSAAPTMPQEFRIDFTTLDELPIVVVESGELSAVRLLIDTDLLVDTYTSLFTCKKTGTCGIGFPIPAPCVSEFDLGGEFAELAAPAFSFP